MSSPWSGGFWPVVQADLRRYGNGVDAAAFLRHWFTPGFRYTFWMRLTGYMRHRGTAWRAAHYLCRLVLRRAALRYGISIPYDTRIGPGLYVGHHGGIVVNHEAVIGRDCNINHGVTIGAKYGGTHAGVPVIGDRVYLGPGCTVIGGIRVGDDVAVGANSVLVRPAADRSVMAGVPARCVSAAGSGTYVVNVTPAEPSPAPGPQAHGECASR